MELLRLLTRSDVRECLDVIDVPSVVEDTLVRHAKGQTMLPAEGYLSWTNSDRAYCRSLAMLGGVLFDSGEPCPRDLYGLKLINAALTNPSRGLERAGGSMFLFDPETARPRLMAEGGLLSALRTAAYTVISLRHLGPPTWDSLALVGTGTLARVHIDLVARYFPEVWNVVAYDTSDDASDAFAAWISQNHPALRLHRAESAREAVSSAPVVVTVTTASDGYISPEWLTDGAFIAHVSLDDLRPEVFTSAKAIYVDDCDLVAANPRRVLGRLIQHGLIGRPESTTVPRITGSLGEVILGIVPASRPGGDIVVSNPFGMAILDVALVGAVETEAIRRGRGTIIDLMGSR
jgi:N-[(2S)-2-amino-2-carboxyethyl]-L-glutamate dehydrogenase